MGEMTEQSDAQLLRDYAQCGHETAFREIVLRHTDLVYSAALRQVASSDIAGNVAQSVFIDLARKARPLAEKMAEGGSLAGWLYRSTRFAALNELRDDRRRLAHERLAMEQLITNSEAAPDWERVRPVLDEAMADLSEEDREALLLRYFKNQDLRTVGLALGVSDDTAQKRVSRAVERLREFFSKRNVTIGAGGLAVLISANAVQSAPVGLAATISAAALLAGTAVHTSTAIAATKAIAMTTLQKTIIGAVLTAAVGAGVFEAHQASQLQNQVQTLQQQQAPLADRVQQLQRERDDATNRLAALLVENGQLKSNPNETELLKLRAEVTRLRNNANATMNNGDTNGPMEAEIKFWLARVEKLKEKLRQSPDKQIPEFQFMTEQSWMFSSQGVNTGTDSAFDDAIKLAQGCAKRDFANALYAAIQKYMAGSNGLFPLDFSEVQPFFDKTVNSSVLQRYEIVQAELDAEIISNSVPPGKSVQFVYRLPGFAGANPTSVERVVMEKAPLYDGDARIVVSKTGVHLQPFR
jgi:RNA polymerase sigma factor (sigma-70 family)